MIKYINEVTIPYMRSQHELLREEKPAVVIMDNFIGQYSASIYALMEANDIHACLLPSNTTDWL